MSTRPLSILIAAMLLGVIGGCPKKDVKEELATAKAENQQLRILLQQREQELRGAQLLFQQQQVLNQNAERVGQARGYLAARELATQMRAEQRFSGAEIPLALARGAAMGEEMIRRDAEARAQALNQARRSFTFMQNDTTTCPHCGRSFRP